MEHKPKNVQFMVTVQLVLTFSWFLVIHFSSILEQLENVICSSHCNVEVSGNVFKS